MEDDLRDIMVVTVEQAVAAPYVSSRLADAGARVIKVERPDGDFARAYDRFVLGQSAYFVWLNRGKESIALDLRAADDVALLHRVIQRADVFIQNLRPGALEKLGFGSEQLRAADPKLITCDITGFGASGPFAHLKAYDLIVQAEVGLCAITGSADTPARIGVSVCDIAAGMTAHAAILQALFVRSRTGRGRRIEVSLFDSVADWMNVPLLQYLYGKYEVQRAGVNHPTIAPYGAYHCGDGTTWIFSIQNEREWTLLCAEVLGMPALARDPRFVDNPARVVNRQQLDEIIESVFRSHDGATVARQLESAGIAYGRLNTIPELSTHPHLRVMTVDTPEGEVRIVAPAALVDGQPAPHFHPVPRLDEHADAIRREFSA